MPQKQFSLFDKQTNKRYNRTIHGGLDPKGGRKEARPFAPRKWLHLVLKSEKARGKWSFLVAKNQTWIRTQVHEMARRMNVAVGDYVNAGDHLHIKVSANQREHLSKYLRTLTGRIASHVTGARKGNPTGRFWQGLAYTRLLKSSFEELRLRGYFEANRKEVIEGKAGREDFLKIFNGWLRRIRDEGRSSPPRAPAWA